MSTVMVPGSPGEALGMLESAMGFLAGADAAQMPSAALAECLRGLERADAIGAAARGRFLAAFDAQDGPVADGQRNTRTWLVHTLRVTRGQAAEHKAVQTLAREHQPLLEGLAEGHIVTKSVALQLARWTRAIPAEFRARAEEILVAAARAGADLRALAAICAEIRSRTAPPDPSEDDGKHLDRGLCLDTTFEGAGVIRGDLTPQCAALVRAVLDALSAPQGRGDLRTWPERYHDALEEAMRRLLASDLLPKRAGQPVKALVHVHFAELVEMDADSVLQEKWIGEYRARWAAQRAAVSVSPGDGGAWLDGDAALAAVCDAMTVPVVIGDIDPGAVEQLITLCVHYDRIRAQASGHTSSQASDETSIQASSQTSSQASDDTSGEAGGGADGAGCRAGPQAQAAADGQAGTGTGAEDGMVIPVGPGGTTARAAGQATGQAEAAGRADQVLAMLEHQILATVLQVVSGPGGVASFLRRTLLGKGLNGPSLPLDVGQSDDIPVHLRRLVALRDQTCRYPGGCDQPAVGCEPHHVIHRADGGRTSLAGLQDWCWWHHHVVLHQLGWTLTVHPDGTSQVTSPDGKTIRSHSPPPRPG